MRNRKKIKKITEKQLKRNERKDKEDIQNEKGKLQLK